MVRIASAVLALMLVFPGPSVAAAQVLMQPLIPIGASAPSGANAPLPPLVPLTPAQSLLNQAYRGVQSAGGSNATLAARGAYAEAIARYHAGDLAGAAADAAWAQAQLPRAAATFVPVAPLPAAPAALGAAPGELPAYITHARNVVLDAQFSGEQARTKAFAALRNAVDAWLDGNAAESRLQAARAETLAAQRR